MDSRARHGRSPWLVVLCLAFLLLSAAPAAAVDTVYWADYSAGLIRYSPTDDSVPEQTLYAGQSFPDGVALDPTNGRIYWANEGTNEIRGAPLSGAGPVTTLYGAQQGLDGVAVDPVAQRIYWVSDSVVRGAPINGGAGGGTIDDVYIDEFNAMGVATDLPASRLYWVREFIEEGGDLRRGPIGGGVPASIFDGEFGPHFVAVDSAAGKVWWTTSFGEVRTGSTDGTGANTLYGGSGNPFGVAADWSQDRLFWGDQGSLNTGTASATGPVTSLAGLEASIHGVALLRTPINVVAPAVSPTEGETGTLLSCTQGDWGIGVPGTFLYRSPTSFGYQWRRDGVDIAGATNPTHVADVAGTYTCLVTGTNEAGATPALSNEAVIVDPPAPPPPPPPPPPTGSPVISMSPEQHHFGSRPVADASPPTQTFTVENSGDADGTITELSITGAEAFAITANDCADATLPPGGRCELVVTFDPASAGSKAAILALDSTGGEDDAALTGVGLDPEGGRIPDDEEGIPANLNLIAKNHIVLHDPFVNPLCRTSRRTLLRRCLVYTLAGQGQLIGTGSQSVANASQRQGRRGMRVRVRISKRGLAQVGRSLGGVPVRLRGLGRLTDGRVRGARKETRLYAERHHLVPPFAGIFVADKPILLPSGRRFLLNIAKRARRVDIVRCDGHAAELPRQFVNLRFANSLALERAHVACNLLRRHGMRARFVKIGHSNTITRQPGVPRTNRRSWPPDRRSGITLIRR
jgi:hypothetical protein